MSDSISFPCPNCSTQLDVPVELAGISGPCPNCGETITAPSASTDPATKEPTPPATGDDDAVTDSVESSASDESKPTPGEQTVDDPSDPSDENLFSSGSDIESDKEWEPAVNMERSISWRQPIINGLIGFVSVVALAAAIWGITKLFDEGEDSKSNDLAARYERKAPSSSPGSNIDKLETLANNPLEPGAVVIEGGNLATGNSIKPISNTTQPPAIDAESLSVVFPAEPVNPNAATDQNLSKLERLLGQSLDSSESDQKNLSQSDRKILQARKLIREFLAADTLEERLPLMFSERVPASEMAEAFSNTILNKPIEIARTVSVSPLRYIGFEGPNAEGVDQQYFSAVLDSYENGKPQRHDMILHMANHIDGQYRINADVFLYNAENQLEQFVTNPQSDSIIAYLFLERCHYKGGVENPPSGTFCVRLLPGPYHRSSMTALVDSVRKPGAILNPLIKWGIPPRAAVVELKHEKDSSGEYTIYINTVLKLNWLLSYKDASSEEE